MNIFVLHCDVKTAAEGLCDLHTSKMTLETAQILCEAGRQLGLSFSPTYKTGWQNHPCVKWAAQNMYNYAWTIGYGQAVAQSYRTRFGRSHKSFDVIMAANNVEPVQAVVHEWRAERPGARGGFNNFCVKRGTPPPLVVSEPFHELHEIRVAEYIQRAEEQEMGIFTKWDLIAGTYREYYAFEKATQPWATWRYGKPYFLDDYDSLETWKRLNKTPKIEKVLRLKEEELKKFALEQGEPFMETELEPMMDGTVVVDGGMPPGPGIVVNAEENGLRWIDLANDPWFE